MHPRTIELLTYLDEQRAALQTAFLTVPSSLRDQTPGAGRWSAAGVIEHVALVERFLGTRLQREITDARADGLEPEQDTTPVLPTLTSAIARKLDRTNRFEAPATAQPTGQTASVAWAALEQAGAEIREALMTGDGLALGRRFLSNRVLGEKPLYYYFAFVGAHEARHAMQIREIGQQLGV
jgi:hypothetical protein